MTLEKGRLYSDSVPPKDRIQFIKFGGIMEDCTGRPKKVVVWYDMTVPGKGGACLQYPRDALYMDLVMWLNESPLLQASFGSITGDACVRMVDDVYGVRSHEAIIATLKEEK